MTLQTHYELARAERRPQPRVRLLRAADAWWALRFLRTAGILVGILWWSREHSEDLALRAMPAGSQRYERAPRPLWASAKI